MRTNKELTRDLLDLAEQSRANIVNARYISKNMNDVMLKFADINTALVKLSFELLKKLQ